MNLLLDTLIQEYKDLKLKLNKVEDLIKMYGGQIPEMPNSEGPTHLVESRTHTIQGITYPKNGTWKEKILFVLQTANKGEARTAKEIAKSIELLEGFHPVLNGGVELNTEHILKTVTQYTSSMFKAGEIGADNSGFRNKYFLNS